MNHFVKSKASVKNKIIAMATMCALCLSACGTDKKVEEEAQKIVRMVENNDMKSLEKLLFETNELSEDEELSDFFETEDEETDDNGVIAKIVAHDSLKIKKITDDKIIYEINSPNLENMLQDVMANEKVTQENFEKSVYDYIESADMKKVKVDVPYTYENKLFTADYATEEFVNGITGNVMSSYQKLVQEMISENSGEDAE